MDMEGGDKKHLKDSHGLNIFWDFLCGLFLKDISEKFSICFYFDTDFRFAEDFLPTTSYSA